MAIDTTSRSHVSGFGSVGPFSGARGTAPSAADLEKTRKAADDFESMTLDQMLQPMFATMDGQSGMFDGGSAEQTLKPMLVTEFAKMMEQRGGLGLEKPIMEAMLLAKGAKR